MTYGDRHRHGRRPVPLPADRSARSTCTSSARAGTRSCGRSSAPTCARYPSAMGDIARHLVRRVGAERPRPCAWSATSTTGTGATHAMRSLGAIGRLGAVRPRRRRRRPVQVRDPGARTAPGAQKADPLAKATEQPPATASVVVESDHTWHDDEWLASAAATDPHSGPLSVYEVHLGSWRPGSRLPRARGAAHRLRRGAGLHARRAAARRRAPVRRLVGLPGHRRTTRRPRGSATPTTSATSSTSCTRPASASSSTGCPRTSRRTSSPSRRFDGTPLYEHPDPRARRAARTGARSSSTSAAARCATSSSRTPPTGSRSSTSTRCAWTPSPRCSTSTTRATHGEWSPNVYGGRENLEAIDVPPGVERDRLPAHARAS